MVKAGNSRVEEEEEEEEGGRAAPADLSLRARTPTCLPFYTKTVYCFCQFLLQLTAPNHNLRNRFPAGIYNNNKNRCRRGRALSSAAV